jgi:hypothetical protein
VKRVLAGLVLAASLLLPARGSAQVASEYDIKAAFLYNFTGFVAWPGHDPEQTAPFVIGIVGKDPFGRTIDDAMRSKSIAGRTIVIRRWGSAKDVGACDLLFVSASEADNLELIQKVLGRSPVLTVGEHPGFIRRGGIINFVKDEGKVRFEISPEAARRTGLVISSKLLNLARATTETRK